MGFITPLCWHWAATQRPARHGSISVRPDKIARQLSETKRAFGADTHAHHMGRRTLLVSFFFIPGKCGLNQLQINVSRGCTPIGYQNIFDAIR